MKSKIAVLLLLTISYSSTEYTIPPVTLEAYTPSGLRVSIPDSASVQLFGFHGNINKAIRKTDPGEFTEDVTKPQNGFWSYYTPNVNLKPGDVVNYWIFVQNGQLGYRRDDQSWTVKNLLASNDSSCKSSITKRAGVDKVCAGGLLLVEEFDGDSLDTSKWIQEQYIPSTGPDYEFCYYKKDATSITQGRLYIKPTVATSEDKLRLPLDLKKGCTKSYDHQCYSSYVNFLQLPVSSSQLTSRLQFQYGKVEIKAKLPGGDWLYPQIYLEDTVDPNYKILIAFNHGNRDLTDGAKKIDVSVLFGGPIIKPELPDRNKYLVSHSHTESLAKNVHTYTLEWTPTDMKLFFDNQIYGTVPRSSLPEFSPDQNRMFRLVLGIGVGGNNNFPDDSVKPWKNWERNIVRDFFLAKDNWYPSWVQHKATLKIESVKIWAL